MQYRLEGCHTYLHFATVRTFMQTRNRTELMSVYLVQMINHFGEHGGFEAMLKRAVVR